MTGTFGPLDLDAIREWNRDNRRARAEYDLNPLTHDGVWGYCLRGCGATTQNLSGVCRNHKGEK